MDRCSDCKKRVGLAMAQIKCRGCSACQCASCKSAHLCAQMLKQMADEKELQLKSCEKMVAKKVDQI